MIPKVTGYKGFNSYQALPYSQLKPGQTKLDRQYYEKATNEKPNGQNYLGNFSRFQSNHQGNIDLKVTVQDFAKKRESGNMLAKYELAHDPDLSKYTKMGRSLFKNAEKAAAKRSGSTQPAGPGQNNIAGKVAAMQQLEQRDEPTHYKTTNHWKTSYA